MDLTQMTKSIDSKNIVSKELEQNLMMYCRKNNQNQTLVRIN